ncbi:MAG: ABC transporter substrate-binding protein [Gemmataceae bacterium]
MKTQGCPAARLPKDDPAAIAAAKAWLKISGTEPTLQEAAGLSLLDHVRAEWSAGRGLAARLLLEDWESRLPSGPATKLREEMQAQAQKLFSDALADAKSVAKLREALDLWPQLPGAADELARRQKTWRVLHVAVPSLPRRLTPWTAWTEAEKQSLDLLFSRLTASLPERRSGAFHWDEAPDLVRRLPWPAKNALPLHLSAAHSWSDGHRLTSVDVRHTYELAVGPLAPRHPLLRELVEKPRLTDQPYQLSLHLRRELFDPFLVTRLHVVPWRIRGAKDKESATLGDPLDPAFAARPVGSGPFFYAGMEKSGVGPAFVVFKANPGYPRGAKLAQYVGEIRFFVWSGPDAKDEPRPDLVFAPRPEQRASLNKLGFRSPDLAPGASLHLVAVNHRRPALAIPEVRLALAHGVHRGDILDKHWNTDVADKEAQARRATGPFRPGTWRYPPADKLKTDPFAKGSDRSYATQAAAKLKETGAKNLTLTLLYPSDDPRIESACKIMTANWIEIFAKTGIAVDIQPKALAPHDLQDALRKRDFDLAWYELADPENIAELWSLLDDHDDAVDSPLGGNFLGYRNDPELTGLFRRAIVPQPFPQLAEKYHRIHVHLHQTMPFLPLWHEPPPLLVHASVTTGLVDPQRIFGRILDWTLAERKGIDK